MCALPAERRALRRLAAPGRELAVSGMGAAAAGPAGEALLGRPARALLAVGFCGALDEDLRVGDLVAAEEVVDERTGERFRPDPALLAAAPGRVGTLVSASALARSPADRAALDGTAVDLESAALARAAQGVGVPFLALRAVSDEAGHRMPDMERLLGPGGLIRPGAAVVHFLTHPGELASLARLGAGARRAGRALAAGTRQLLERYER